MRRIYAGMLCSASQATNSRHAHLEPLETDCSHLYVFDGGHFRCVRCGHLRQARPYKKRRAARAVPGMALLAVLAVAGAGVYLGVLHFDVSRQDIEAQAMGIYDAIPIDAAEDAILGAFSAETGNTLYSSIPAGAIDAAENVAAEISQYPPFRTESGFDHAAVESYIFRLTNEERVAYGIEPLYRTPEIDGIALGHSRDMYDRDYFEHETPEGLGPTGRGQEAGYDCRKNYLGYYTYGLAENIAYGHTYSSYMQEGIPSTYGWLAGEEDLARQLVDGWMNSPGHRENILEEKYNRIGVGVYIGESEEVYATQNFC
ncbi:uncharacterized protein with SCP/PR1 domains [Cenarchaeum symbiosum A]|uniref:Uncharacterized protein with SCP/PR1 domains n=1 Tax=Cenarchaeum symbiosum (strain A) TaxID=414004 RepID=A0RZ56_CENSY|nr:uncharacterized protein with SCP/PR1 domains [Cenarchaeum symbiosum A]